MAQISYDVPPITEAVIGINFASSLDKETYDSINKKYSKQYPSSQQVSNVNLAVKVPVNKVAHVTTKINTNVGQRHASTDMTELLVIWPGSITVSQLAPYHGWDDFFERFKRDWHIWKRNVGFRELSRIGVRYINRIDIPITSPTLDYENYLNVFPRVPDLLGPLHAYALQAGFELEDIGCLLNINSAAVPSPMLNHSSFVVDIDISKERELPSRDEEIFDLLTLIRAKKNAVFESCVTDLARNLFIK